LCVVTMWWCEHQWRFTPLDCSWKLEVREVPWEAGHRHPRDELRHIAPRLVTDATDAFVVYCVHGRGVLSISCDWMRDVKEFASAEVTFTCVLLPVLLLVKVTSSQRSVDDASVSELQTSDPSKNNVSVLFYDAKAVVFGFVPSKQLVVALVRVIRSTMFM
jgi:hypothetical protein